MISLRIYQTTLVLFVPIPSLLCVCVCMCTCMFVFLQIWGFLSLSWEMKNQNIQLNIITTFCSCFMYCFNDSIIFIMIF